MRFGLLALFPLVLGTLLGVGLTWSEYRQLTNHFNLRAEQQSAANNSIPKAVVVNGTEFDFGTLGQQSTGKHTFTIRNEGTSMLQLGLINVSCGKCVETEFNSASVQPGQSVDIPVTFHTRKPGPQFSERAEIGTNDPAMSMIGLQIRGFITRPARVSEEEIVLGNVSGNEPATREFRIFGYESDKLEVVGTEFTNPVNASFFSLESKPLDASKLAEEQHAKVGRLLTLSVKPGLPLGSITQTLRLTVQTTDKQTIDVPIQGTVVSDITVVGGPNFSPNYNVLTFGTLQRSEGARATVQILVKGPFRRDVQMSVGAKDPDDVIHAEMGERTEIANGAIFSYPLTIEIIKGARVVNRLGTDQGKSGRVTIKTTHPTAKEFSIRIRFATE
jgi:hypothetical protein